MANSHLIVTIDGPAGVGKSTIAKCVAEALCIAFLDTGSMFRSIALMFDQNDTDADMQKRLKQLDQLQFSIIGSGERTTLLCNGSNVGDEVRTEKAGALAAKVAIIPEVREALKKAQQSIGSKTPLVAEGRDMGTVIFPNATCKFFLDATPEVRAQRRFLQLLGLGKPADLREITAQIKDRDEKDRNRRVAPLKPAEDAILLDSSEKDLDTVFAEVMEAIHAKIQK